jgi:hypothetical protein
LIAIASDCADWAEKPGRQQPAEIAGFVGRRSLQGGGGAGVGLEG